MELYSNGIEMDLGTSKVKIFDYGIESKLTLYSLYEFNEAIFFSPGNENVSIVIKDGLDVFGVSHASEIYKYRFRTVQTFIYTIDTTYRTKTRYKMIIILNPEERRIDMEVRDNMIGIDLLNSDIKVFDYGPKSRKTVYDLYCDENNMISTPGDECVSIIVKDGSDLVTINDILDFKEYSSRTVQTVILVTEKRHFRSVLVSNPFGVETFYKIVIILNAKEQSEKRKETDRDKVKAHKDICSSLTNLYSRKNADYGDSFGKSFDRFGMTMACIRMCDKLNRLESLCEKKDQKVADESIEDTLMDLANYAIMTLIELKKK